jgi:hypothetical protein
MRVGIATAIITFLQAAYYRDCRINTSIRALEALMLGYLLSARLEISVVQVAV